MFPGWSRAYTSNIIDPHRPKTHLHILARSLPHHSPLHQHRHPRPALTNYKPHCHRHHSRRNSRPSQHIIPRQKSSQEAPPCPNRRPQPPTPRNSTAPNQLLATPHPRKPPPHTILASTYPSPPHTSHPPLSLSPLTFPSPPPPSLILALRELVPQPPQALTTRVNLCLFPLRCKYGNKTIEREAGVPVEER